jgi:hypothetical protein
MDRAPSNHILWKIIKIASNCGLGNVDYREARVEFGKSEKLTI